MDGEFDGPSPEEMGLTSEDQGTDGQENPPEVHKPAEKEELPKLEDLPPVPEDHIRLYRGQEREFTRDEHKEASMRTDYGGGSWWSNDLEVATVHAQTDELGLPAIRDGVIFYVDLPKTMS